MAAFVVIVLVCGFYFGFAYRVLAVMGLVITMLMFLVSALFEGKDFWKAFLKRLGNNNWVYWWVFVSALTCAPIWFFANHIPAKISAVITIAENPLKPSNWSKAAEKLAPTPSPFESKEDNPFTANDEGIHGSFFFGGDEPKWGFAGLQFLLLSLPARFVSYWDESKVKAKKFKKKDKEGWIAGFLKHIVFEFIWPFN